MPGVVWFLTPKPHTVWKKPMTATDHGEEMSSSFLQGVAFFALTIVIVMSIFGGFGAL